MPTILPQSQNKNLLPSNITNTSSPTPRVEPVVQPPRVQTLMTSPTSPPNVKPSTPPRSDQHSNPRIEKPKIKKIPQILPTKQNQAAPQKFQHGLRRSPRNGGTNYCTQAAHNLVTNHLLKF